MDCDPIDELIVAPGLAGCSSQKSNRLWRFGKLVVYERSWSPFPENALHEWSYVYLAEDRRILDAEDNAAACEHINLASAESPGSNESSGVVSDTCTHSETGYSVPRHLTVFYISGSLSLREQ
jgi:hypothetical protein